MFIKDPEFLIFVPESTEFARLSDSIAQRLAQAGITETELLAGLEDARQEIARERYPELFSELAEKDVH